MDAFANITVPTVRFGSISAASSEEMELVIIFRARVPSNAFEFGTTASKGVALCFS